LVNALATLLMRRALAGEDVGVAGVLQRG
jgi:hypothetical protein